MVNSNLTSDLGASASRLRTHYLGRCTHTWKHELYQGTCRRKCDQLISLLTTTEFGQSADTVYDRQVEAVRCAYEGSAVAIYALRAQLLPYAVVASTHDR